MDSYKNSKYCLVKQFVLFTLLFGAHCFTDGRFVDKQKGSNRKVSKLDEVSRGLHINDGNYAVIPKKRPGDIAPAIIENGDGSLITFSSPAPAPTIPRPSIGNRLNI